MAPTTIEFIKAKKAEQLKEKFEEIQSLNGKTYIVTSIVVKGDEFYLFYYEELTASISKKLRGIK